MHVCENSSIEIQILRPGFDFSVIDRIFFNDRKKLGQLGHNIRKYILVNTVTASFNTIGTNDRNVSAKKNSPRLSSS